MLPLFRALPPHPLSSLLGGPGRERTGGACAICSRHPPPHPRLQLVPARADLYRLRPDARDDDGPPRVRQGQDSLGAAVRDVERCRVAQRELGLGRNGFVLGAL